MCATLTRWRMLSASFSLCLHGLEQQKEARARVYGCVYVCLGMCAWVYSCMWACIYVYMYMSCVCVWICMCICVHMYISICICVYMCACICVYTLIWVCMYLRQVPADLGRWPSCLSLQDAVEVSFRRLSQRPHPGLLCHWESSFCRNFRMT